MLPHNSHIVQKKRIATTKEIERMKYQIKLSIFISFLLINCSVKETEFEIICTKKSK